MRITFDKQMSSGEELHRQEAKASAVVKRLAIENEYVFLVGQHLEAFKLTGKFHIYSQLLDLLYEINNSAQIPLEKRIDISLKPEADAKGPTLEVDNNYSQRKEQALKRLEQLLNDIPHSSYDASVSSNAAFADDLSAAKGETHPTSFLTADDVDDYIYTVTGNLPASDSHVPTLAPAANQNGHFARSNPHLKNPTSVSNWLRKNAPKSFLQDNEAHADGGDDGDNSKEPTTKRGRGGGAKAERGAKSGGTSRGKRSSLAPRAGTADGDASMDDDGEYGTPAPRGKRKRDDDAAGYKPSGSASRPSKKTRKSEGEATSGGGRKSKKNSPSVGKDD